MGALADSGMSRPSSRCTSDTGTFETIRNILEEQLPAHTQLLYLQGEMCRSDLLLEIEVSQSRQDQ